MAQAVTKLNDGHKQLSANSAESGGHGYAEELCSAFRMQVKERQLPWQSEGCCHRGVVAAYEMCP